MTQLTRRSTLGLLGALGFSAGFQLAHAAEAGERKFIFILMRGAMDGLAALIPDDTEMLKLRQATLPAASERLDLGNGFRLHPSLSGLHSLYQTGAVGFVPAAATAYRDRSHFDGQDLLEIMGAPGQNQGWLNRAVEAVGGTGLAVGYALPLALRGSGKATNWSPPVFDNASEDLLDRLQRLYGNQPVLGEPLAMARATPMQDAGMGMGRGGGPGQQYVESSKALGKLLAADDGPNIGMLSFDGWDTHANQAGQFTTRLGGLDAAIETLKTALGPQWAKTCIVACSEFGRTAAENGTRGTDHGTGGLMILAGGAVSGGKVYGDWPGLRARDLHEGRDVAPANNVASVLAGLLRDHLGIDRSTLQARVLPSAVDPMNGLIRV